MSSPTPATAEDAREALAKEYGTYVALTAINVNGARAFNAGDPVPVSHVVNGVVGEGQVSKITTKAGRVAAGIADESKG